MFVFNSAFSDKTNVMFFNSLCVLLFMSGYREPGAGRQLEGAFPALLGRVEFGAASAL